MAHFHHHSPAEKSSPAESSRNARIGLILFAIYSSLYLIFVLLNAFAPRVMETIVFAGVNLAVIYGLGLIVAAFLIALAYAWFCRSRTAL